LTARFDPESFRLTGGDEDGPLAVGGVLVPVDQGAAGIHDAYHVMNRVVEGVVEAVAEALAAVALGLMRRVVVDPDPGGASGLAKLVHIIPAPYRLGSLRDVLPDDQVRAVPLLHNPLAVMIEMIAHRQRALRPRRGLRLKIARLAGGARPVPRPA
jgi:hypothetical protein